MLLRLRRGLPGTQTESILALAKELGYRARLLEGATGGSTGILHLEGPGAPEHRSRFEDCAGVEAVLDAGEARERHERLAGQPDTVVTVGEARFGGGHIALIAGPCAVESEERLLDIARAVRAAGAVLLRGGAYKPRTSPYSFQGKGEEGLELLARARAETGLGIVTEVLDPRDVGKVAEVADMLQIGARSMTNTPLLAEVGATGQAILLKRGFAATVREFLLAAEFLLARGNPRVVLCERGVRGFDKTTRNLLDVGAVAHLKLATHLPVIVDPSHAAGRGDLVRPLARAGLAAGADGLMVEVHTQTSEARSDGAQAISAELFAAIAKDAAAIGALDRRTLARPRASAARA
jgi:3-deoxy-7-phosphoheptulonate synthase